MYYCLLKRIDNTDPVWKNDYVKARLLDAVKV